MSKKALFITGASSGIGAATARLAVEKGWQVGLFARSEDKLNALVEELGDSATALPGDVTDFDSVTTAMDEFAAKAGGLDAVYANAGGHGGAFPPRGGTDAGDPDEWGGADDQGECYGRIVDREGRHAASEENQGPSVAHGFCCWGVATLQALFMVPQNGLYTAMAATFQMK